MVADADEDLKRRRRAAKRYDLGLVALWSLGPFIILCLPSFDRSPSLGEVTAPITLLGIWAVLVSLALSQEELNGRSFGERRHGLVRLRQRDGFRVDGRDWLRRHWPALWLLAGLIALATLYAKTGNYDYGTTRRLVQAMQRWTLGIGLITVVPPAVAYVVRAIRGDGTIVVNDPNGRRPFRSPRRRGFEVIVKEDEPT